MGGGRVAPEPGAPVGGAGGPGEDQPPYNDEVSVPVEQLMEPGEGDAPDAAAGAPALAPQGLAFASMDLGDAVPDVEEGDNLFRHPGVIDAEPPPSMELARAKAAAMRPRQPDGTPYSIAGTSVDTLGAVFGTGIAIWANTSRTLARTFGAMALLSAFALWATVTAGLAADATTTFVSPLSLISAGALHLVAMDEECVGAGGEGCVSDAIGGLPRDRVVLAMVALDVLAVLVFLFAVLRLNGMNDRIDASADQQAITVDDYAVQVFGLPTVGPDTSIEKVRRFFLQFGRVVDVVNATDLSASLSKRRRLAEEVKGFDEATARGDAARASTHRALAESLAAELKAEEADTTRNTVVATFVTFEEEEAALRCRDAMPAERVGFLGLLGGGGGGDYRYGDAGVSLRAARAPAPSELLWENMRCGWWERQARKLLGLLVLLLLLGCTIVVAGAAKNQLNRMPARVNCMSVMSGYGGEGAGNLVCEAIWPLFNSTTAADARARIAPFLDNEAPNRECRELIRNYRFTHDLMGALGGGGLALGGDAEGLDGKGRWAGGYDPGSHADECASQVCYSCYCDMKGLLAWHESDGERPLALSPFCDDYWMDQLYFTGLLTGVLAVVAAGNVLLRHAAIWLGSFEMHHTVSDRDRSIASMLAIALTLNTSVVPVMTYAYIRELQGVPFFFSGDISDIGVAWYDIVAAAIVTSAMINSVVMPTVKYALAALASLKAACLSRRAKTQAQLDELQTPPRLLLSDMYGETTAMVFYCMIFSAGLPILHLVMAFQMLLSYAITKILLLSSVRTPPRYSAALATAFQSALPWAAVLHLALAVWIFGHRRLTSVEVDTSAVNTGNADVDGFLDAVSEDYDDQFGVATRLSRLNALIPFVALAVVVGILVLLYVLKTFGSALTTVCQCLGLCMSKAEKQGNPPLSEAIRKGELIGLASYRADANPAYEKLFQETRRGRKHRRRRKGSSSSASSGKKASRNAT